MLRGGRAMRAFEYSNPTQPRRMGSGGVRAKLAKDMKDMGSPAEEAIRRLRPLRLRVHFRSF